MMHDLRFTGRLGANIEVKPDKNGNSFGRFSLASDDGKKGSEYHKTNWLPFTIKGRLADNAAASLGKGDMVEVIAKADTYEETVNINGEDKKRTNTVFRTISISPSLAFATVTIKKNDFPDDNAGSGQRRQSNESRQETREEPRQAPAKEPAKASVGANDLDDF